MACENVEAKSEINVMEAEILRSQLSHARRISPAHARSEAAALQGIKMSLSPLQLVVIYFNHLEYLWLQYHSALAFLPPSSFEYVIYDNRHSWSSTPESMAEEDDEALNDLHVNISQVIPSVPRLPSLHVFCRFPQVRCRRVITADFESSGSASHASAVDLMFIDGDMFFIRPWDVQKWTDEERLDVASPMIRVRAPDETVKLNSETDLRWKEYLDQPPVVTQMYFKHLWPNLFMLNRAHQLPGMRQLSFQLGHIAGVNTDTGGHSALWLRAHPELRIAKIDGYITMDEFEDNYFPNPHRVCLGLGEALDRSTPPLPPEIIRRFVANEALLRLFQVAGCNCTCEQRNTSVELFHFAKNGCSCNKTKSTFKLPSSVRARGVFLANFAIMHFGRGSNWNREMKDSYNEQRLAMLLVVWEAVKRKQADPLHVDGLITWNHEIDGGWASAE